MQDITPQIFSVGIVVAMMAAFVWGRFRFDLVAVAALLAAIGTGVVPFEDAFTGFSNDIVIIVACALVVSAGVARSGVMEAAIRRLAPGLRSVRAQLAFLVITVTVLSAFVKNIGALAIMLPIAVQFARRSGVSPSVFLMPMSFGSLLGGLMTLIGTSPNIIVSGVREQITGQRFAMFDFLPVGGALAASGIVFLVLFHWLVPVRAREGGALHEAIDISNYTAEGKVGAGSPVAGGTVADLLKLSRGEAVVTSIVRSGRLRLAPLPDATLREGDVILFEGDPEALDHLAAAAGLDLSGERETEGGPAHAIAVEGVIAANSSLINWSAERLALFDRFKINLLAVSRRGERILDRPGSFTLKLGDVIVVQGSEDLLPQVLRDLGVLPLVERPILLGSLRRGAVPIFVLLAAMVFTALELVPVPIAFFAAAVAMVLFRTIPLREVYNALDGPILVMLAALIPVSGSLERTGATDSFAAWLAAFGDGLAPAGSLALILVVSMAVTPFLNNAATVLVVAPIAAGFAATLGYAPEAFLMAVAIGAGCDFLTPIGHQCNTLVMRPGGYRFSDYPRLGLPLSLLVIAISLPMLLWVWPVQ